jgi:hypothetical protein
MKYHVPMIALLLTSYLSAAAQSKDEKHVECRQGNLLEEDRSTVVQMGHFLDQLQAGISHNDKRRVARLAHYPLSVATAESEFTIRSEDEFISTYDKIFPTQLKKFLLRQETRCISWVGTKGFTIGSGQIWFDKVSDGTVRMFSINAIVYPDDRKL